jgi:hypothetical protein
MPTTAKTEGVLPPNTLYFEKFKSFGIQFLFRNDENLISSIYALYCH